MHGRRDASAWQAALEERRAERGAAADPAHARTARSDRRLFPPEQRADFIRSAKEVNAMSRGRTSSERAVFDELMAKSLAWTAPSTRPGHSLRGDVAAGSWAWLAAHRPTGLWLCT